MEDETLLKDLDPDEGDFYTRTRVLLAQWQAKGGLDDGDAYFEADLLVAKLAEHGIHIHEGPRWACPGLCALHPLMQEELVALFGRFINQRVRLDTPPFRDMPEVVELVERYNDWLADQ